MKTQKAKKAIVITGLIIIAAIILALVLVPRIQQFKFDMEILKNKNSGNVSANIALYDEMIRKSPSSENYLGRASNYVHLQEYEAAIQDIGLAFEKESPAGEAYALLLTIGGEGGTRRIPAAHLFAAPRCASCIVQN